jgi:GT2 family glycosyltransferase
MGIFRKIGKFNRIRREQGLPGLRLHARYFARAFGERRKYQKWIEAHKLTDEQRAGVITKIESFEQEPLISIVMPVYNVEEKWLRACIESVIAQLYPNWELCIADDASPAEHIRRVLDEYAARDERIKVTYRAENGHISAASNSALELVTGEFTALLDHDDELAEDALFWVAAEINEHPEAAMLYSDEDKIDGAGRRSEPKFKPDWSRDLFYSLNLITHLSVYRTDLLRAVGGFRVGYEGSQDHDLALRVTEQIPETAIRHIPRILYHWRAIPGSVALSGEAKPYAYEKAREAIRSHFERMGVSAGVEAAADNLHRVRYTLPDSPPSASLILAVDNEKSAFEAINVFSAVDYPNFEVLIVCSENLKSGLDAADFPENVRVLVADEMSEAGRYNSAVLQAEGDILFFVDPALKPLSADWLREMAAFAVQDGIGAVGAKILEWDKSVLHSGLIVGTADGISPAHQGIPRDEAGYFFRNGLINNFSAVSISAFATTRALFMEMQGFDDENFPDKFYDADYCLRLWRRNRRVVFTPYAEFICSDTGGHLSFERTGTAEEVAAFNQKWKEAAERDPFYNPNLSRENGNFEIDI